jgi:hypothetical protein
MGNSSARIGTCVAFLSQTNPNADSNKKKNNTYGD